MSVSVRRCAIGVATSAAMILASAAPALALTQHQAPAKRKPAAAQSFKVHGVVLGVSGNKVKVLSSVAKVGKTTARNKIMTLTLTPKTHKSAKARTHPVSKQARLMAAGMAAPVAPVLAVGDDITAVGTVTSTGTPSCSSTTRQPVTPRWRISPSSIAPNGVLIPHAPATAWRVRARA